MPVQPAFHLGVAIDVAYDRAQRFLGDPANLPRWASGLGASIRRLDGSDWLAETPAGPIRIRFTPMNPYGILDHWVMPGAGDPIYVPMRVMANGDGCEVLFTLFRRPEMSEDDFQRDADWVRRDLAALKALLEAGAPTPSVAP
jgi:hypothetical protein